MVRTWRGCNLLLTNALANTHNFFHWTSGIELVDYQNVDVTQLQSAQRCFNSLDDKLARQSLTWMWCWTIFPKYFCRHYVRTSWPTFFAQYFAQYYFRLAITETITSIKVVDAVFVSSRQYLIGRILVGCKAVPSWESQHWGFQSVFANIPATKFD